MSATLTPASAIAAVRRATGADARRWQVTPHLDGWLVAIEDEPLAVGGGVWLVSATGDVADYAPQFDGFPAARRTSSRKPFLRESLSR